MKDEDMAIARRWYVAMESCAAAIRQLPKDDPARAEGLRVMLGLVQASAAGTLVERGCLLALVLAYFGDPASASSNFESESFS